MPPTRRQRLPQVQQERSDLLQVCNDQRVAFDHFKAAFCDRCLQPECTRSRIGGDKFEKRVANWYVDLFAAPPRMDPQDPRFEMLAGKKFLMIDTGSIPEVGRSSAWLDPRDLTEGPPPPTRAPAPVTPPDPEFMAPIPRKTEVPLPRQQVPGRLTPMNTPTTAPRMIGNAPPPAPKKDAWAGPTSAPTTTETIVAPGAKVRTRGSGSGGV